MTVEVLTGEIVDDTAHNALALPEPESVALVEVRTALVPRVRAARERIRESGNIANARELTRWLEAVRRYLTDRNGRDMIAAETRRTEVLIGEMLGPGVQGQHLPHTHSGVRDLGRQDRIRFRLLAEHAEAVEVALNDGVVSRKALLERIQYQPSTPSPLGDGLCSTLVADQPWRYGNTATRANANGHYDGTLSIAQLCGEELMPDGTNLVKEVVNPKSASPGHLYLWTTAGHLPEAFSVMAAWGYTYKTYIVWIKKKPDGRPQMGMGNYFRVSTELVLFGIKGDLRTQDRGLLNWIEAPRGQHSAKPLAFHDLVAKASPGPYLELFARCGAGTGSQLPGVCQCTRCRLGWEVWGNQT